jgi:preprotein translocase subunit SecA
MAEYLESAVSKILAAHADDNEAPDFWDYDGLALAYQTLALKPLPVAEKERLEIGYDALRERLVDQVLIRYREKEAKLTPAITRQLERFVLLQVIDEHWRDHLNQLILLRSGIGLRSYAQRDPLVEYKAESYRMFEALMDAIERESVRLFFRAEIAPRPETAQPVTQMETQHEEVAVWSQRPAGRPAAATADRQPSPAPGGEPVGKPRPVKRQLPKVGRNDPCPCGSGKKYKKCCGQ